MSVPGQFNYAYGCLVSLFAKAGVLIMCFTRLAARDRPYLPHKLGDVPHYRRFPHYGVVRQALAQSLSNQLSYQNG